MYIHTHTDGHAPPMLFPQASRVRPRIPSERVMTMPKTWSRLTISLAIL